MRFTESSQNITRYVSATHYRYIRDSFRNARIRLEIEIKIGLKYDQAKL